MSREMKNSGSEWIGKIPKEWEIVPAKSMFVQRNGKGNKCVLQLLSPTQKFGVIPQSLYEEKTGQNAVKLDEKIDLSALKTMRKGDYCISLRSFQGGFELSEYEGVVSPAYQVFYPIKAISQRYYKHLFKTQRFIDEMNSYTMSLRDGKNIAFADFGKSYIPVPPLSEQKRIGNYLDFKCSQIDQLSDNIKQQIEELGEYKKALITQAVTKGLDPDVEMKDSGIKWIGEIPSHWSILRIANIYTERSETGCKDDLPILMVSINSGVSNGEVLDEERTRMVVRSEDKSLYKRVYPDDLVYNTMRAWQGAFGAVRVNGLVSPAYVTAAPKIDIDSRYIEYLLRTPPAKEEMKRYSYGIADFRMRLYWQYFKNISVALPPLDEQHHIASFIDSSYFKIDSVIKKKSELLETLQDYKKSLIYDYVTGKREVPVSYRKGGSHE